MQYLVIFEKLKDGSIWAQVPGLPGCFSSGDTIEEAKVNVVEAIEFHLEGLRAEGLEIPVSFTKAELITVDA